MDRTAHWESMYARKTERDVSWFESVPEVSLRLLESAGMRAETCVLDVGGGDSRLVDTLIARGIRGVTVLDISEAALARARARLGDAASIPRWVHADVTGEWTTGPVDIWHDRAVFHFLTDAGERDRYREHLDAALNVGGSAILATFALDGPQTCSGLPVARYSPEMLARELGERFSLVESVAHQHQTPWGAAQSFQYSRFVRRR